MCAKRVIDKKFPGPLPINEPEPEEQVDPENFKKAMMKAKKPDEMQEHAQRKRNRDEKDPEKKSSAASTSFSELMKDNQEKGSIFDAESSGIRKQEIAQQSHATYKRPRTRPPTPQSPFEVISSQQHPDESSKSSYPSGGSVRVEEKQPTSSHRDNVPTSDQSKDSQKQQSTTEKKQKKEQLAYLKKEVDTSLLTSQTERGALKVRKKTKKTQKIVPYTSSVKATKVAAGNKSQKKQTKSNLSNKNKTEKNVRKKPSSLRTKKTTVQHQNIEKKPSFLNMPKNKKPLKTRALSSSKKMKKDVLPSSITHKQPDVSLKNIDTTKRKSQNIEGAIPPPCAQTALTSPPFSDIPAYSKLPPEIFELFERIVGVIIVQEKCGITETTVTINKPESLFDKAQIVLTQYSTAPKTINLQLVGSQEAGKFFLTHVAQLEEAFKQSLDGILVNILNPVLPTMTRKKSPHLIRRKSATGNKGGKKDTKK